MTIYKLCTLHVMTIFQEIYYINEQQAIWFLSAEDNNVTVSRFYCLWKFTAKPRARN